MKKEYNFAKMKEVKPAYLKKLKQQVTIKLDREVIEYFKKLAIENDVPYQTLINLYLRDCSMNKKKPAIKWDKAS